MPGVTTPPHSSVHPSERQGGGGPIRFWVVTAAAVAAVLLLATGCSSDDGDDDSASTTTVVETTTTAPESTTTSTTEPRTPEEEVEEAYWEAERVLDDLLQAPDPDDPRLAETRVDPSLSQITSVLQGLIDDGVHGQFAAGEPPPREVASVAIDGSSATVVACRIDNMLIIDSATNATTSDQVVSTLIEFSLTQEGDGWKITRSDGIQTWNDGLGCDRP